MSIVCDILYVERGVAPMEYMTAEQAAKAARGLTFEKVWAALMEHRAEQEESHKRLNQMFEESDKRMEEERKESNRRFEESNKRMEEERKESDKRFEEERKESDKRFEEERKESKKRMEESHKQAQEELRATRKLVDDLSRNIGGLNNSFGQFVEEMLTPGLWEKFNMFGFTFSKQSQRVKFAEGKQVVAEADLFVEDGDYAMVVEVKTDLSIDDVNEHIKRIGRIRGYMDKRGDERKLLGAVAGGTVAESVLNYAQKKGLYVITQSGDSATISPLTQGFEARMW